jgi:hypothetical protein
MKFQQRAITTLRSPSCTLPESLLGKMITVVSIQMPDFPDHIYQNKTPIWICFMTAGIPICILSSLLPWLPRKLQLILQHRHSKYCVL